MILPVLKFFRRSTLVFMEIVAGLVFLMLGVMCVLFWKLSQGPVDITFAADTIKSVLVSSDHTTDLQFSSIVAEWPEFSGPISVGLSDVRLVENNKPVLRVPQLGVRIAKAPLFIGLVRPEAIIAKNATIKLYRGKTGGVHLFLSDVPPPPEDQTPVSAAPAPASTSAPAPAQNAASLGLKDIGEAFFKGGTLADYHELQPLAHLEQFSIDGAHVIIVDEATGKGLDIPKLDIDLLRKRKEFELTASYKEGKEDPTNFSFVIRKDTDNDQIVFENTITHLNASSLVTLFYPHDTGFGAQFLIEGHVKGRLDSNWDLQSLDGNLTSQNGKLNLDGVLEAPLQLSDIQANIAFDQETKSLVLQDTHVIVNGRRIELSGKRLDKQTPSVLGLNVVIPETSFDDIQSLWPKNQRDSIAAEWLTKNLSKAKIKNLHITAPIDLAAPENFDPTQLDGSFSFENLTADYRAPLIPVTGAKGSATLKGDVLLVKVDSGKMADLVVDNGTVEITHLTHPTIVGDVTIHAALAGQIGTVLDYIGREPINLGETVGIKPDQVKGTTSLNAKVVFPALKDLPADQVRVEVDATLKDILLPSVVHGLDLTGGPYNLTVKGGAVTIAGQGALGGKAIDLTYMQAINLAESDYLSKIKAKITTDAALRTKFGANLDQFVAGDVPVTIDYTEAKTKDETIGIVADVTPAVVMFSPFKYRKPAGIGGQVTCTVTTHNGEVQKISDLKLAIDKGGSASGSIVFGKVGDVQDVKSGKFSNFTMAGANNFALDFTQTAPNVFDVSIQGKQLDGRPFLSGGNKVVAPEKTSAKSQTPQKDAAVTARVSVTQIKTGPNADQMLTKPVLSLQTNDKGDVAFLDLSGQIKGGSLSVSLKPDAQGKMQLKIASNNAGSALHTLDLYDQVIGGALDISGSQIDGGGLNDIAGKAQITNFTVVRAPVLAKLINLFSLSGLTELLQNKGIEFEKLRTRFEWKNTSSGRVIALQNGRTSGASIGLTFGGNMYQDTGTLDISGTFVPISQINGLVNQIPLIGNLLTGGKNGGVIAATYAMKGKSDDPSVFINPLSVLTPGFLRSILFENNSSIFDDKPDRASSTPVPKPKKKSGSYNR